MVRVARANSWHRITLTGALRWLAGKAELRAGGRHRDSHTPGHTRDATASVAHFGASGFGRQIVVPESHSSAGDQSHDR